MKVPETLHDLFEHGHEMSERLDTQSWSSRFVNTVMVGDKVIWTVLIMLLIISTIEVYSASSNMTFQSGNYWAPALSHVSTIIMGLVACSVIAHLNMTAIKVLAVMGNFVSITLLLCALLFGERVNGAGRWFLGMQPSEIAKGVLMVTVALILSLCVDERTKHVTSRGFWWTVGLTGLNCLLIVTENLSTALLLAVSVAMIMFIARVPLKWLGGLIAPFLIGGGVVFTFMKTASDDTIQKLSQTTTALHRLPTWANRIRSGKQQYTATNYPLNDNLQVAHAKIAVATSGILGCGPGNSVERDYLPQAYSDFIFAIIIEEFGLLGGAFVLMLYIALLFQVGTISRQSKERFPQLLAMGLVLLITTQAMFNMGVAVGLLPVTGQQLPLVSRGGTGIIINCCYIGIILAVSCNIQRHIDKENELLEQEAIEA